MGADISHDQIIPVIMFMRKDWLPELSTCVAVESPMPRRAHLVKHSADDILKSLIILSEFMFCK